MREIVLDTETTGLDPESGDRLVEIACLELMDRIPTGRVWHYYINPERDMPAGAFAVHGLSSAFLSDKAKFAELAQDFLDFIKDAKLVIHNAAFDIKFLNHELARLDRPPLSFDHVIDTLTIAKRKHAGAQNNLDALCRRYNVDNRKRTKHGALLDTELLAEVYLNLIDAHQPALDFGRAARTAAQAQVAAVYMRVNVLARRLTHEELEAHTAFVSGFKSPSLWNQYR
ncbi:MAG: DNA polymerase III subunit epsilon [Chitinophagales bacterium]|nr:DNA polymerase III subunit epsilon [Hyphomicrobiales bacterium]